MEQLVSLTDAVTKGRAILFLGQSHIRWSGQQSLDVLIDPLLSALRLDVSREVKAQGLLEACRELIEKRGVPMERLLHHLHAASTKIPLGSQLEKVVQAPWRSIFTTAIDDLLSRALYTVTDRSVRTIYDDQAQLGNVRDADILNVIRLRGSIDQIDPLRTPAFSQSDRLSRRRTIRGLLDSLVNIASVDGVVVLAGFDLSEEGHTLSAELWQRIEELPTQRCYWFEPDVRQLEDSEIRSLVNQEILHPVFDKTLDSFVAGLPVSTAGPRPSRRVVMTPHGEIEFSSSRWRSLKQQLVILDKESALTEPPHLSPTERYGRFREFLRGDRPLDWTSYAAGFAFKRTVFDEIASVVVKRLRHTRATQNRVLLVSGSSGSGKTVLLEYLAWHVAREQHPVVYLPKRPQEPDFRTIEAFCQEVQPKRQARSSASAGTRVLIIWDSITADPATYRNLASYLTSVGKPTLVIGTTYATPSHAAREDMTDADELADALPRGGNFALTGSLSKTESQRFLDYLGEVDSELAGYIDIGSFQAALQEDFLVALYDFIPATRSNLSKGVRQEYKWYEEKLRPLLDSFFGGQGQKWSDLLPLVFVPSQFGCYPNLELVLRALGPAYLSLWIRERPQLQIEGLFNETADLRLKARHPRVAQMAMKMRYSVADQVRFMAKLTRAANAGGEVELDFLRKLFFALRETRSDDYPARPFRGQRKELAEILAGFRKDKSADPELMHTEGILWRRYAQRDIPSTEFEKRVETFQLSIQVMDQARDLIERDTSHFRQKAQLQIIANSIASAYRDLIDARLVHLEAGSADNRREIELAIENEKKQLKTYCELGSLGVRPNVYPVDVWVTSLLNRYHKDRSLDAGKKGELIAEMLDELDRAEENFREENLETLLRTRLEVEKALGDETLQQQTIARLQSIGSLSGFYLKARLEAYVFDPTRRQLVSKGREGLEKAISILRRMDKGQLSRSPQCLSLLSRLWWEAKVGHRVGTKRNLAVALTASEWGEYREILETQLKAEVGHGESNLFLLFNLGWSAFQEGNFRLGIDYFRQLESISHGSRFRIASLTRYTDEHGEPRLLSGQVADLRDEQHGIIYCPSIRLDIAFNRFAFNPAPAKNDSVEFEVVFNFRGPLAVPPT